MSARAKPATALPWVSLPCREGFFGKPDSMKDAGCSIRATEPKMFGGTEVTRPGIAPADAAYIVTACNAFPQLVAALRDLLVTVDLWERGAEESERGDPERNARALLRSLGEL